MTTWHTSLTTAWPRMNNGRRRSLCDLERRQTTVLVPFVDWVSQPLQRMFRPLRVRVVGKPRNCKWSLQQLKDRTSQDDQPGVVYRLKCGDCEQSYIGETWRTACVRVKEDESYVKIDDLTDLLLLSTPFLSSMLLILTMWESQIVNVTSWSGESRKRCTSYSHCQEFKVEKNAILQELLYQKKRSTFAD